MSNSESKTAVYFWEDFSAKNLRESRVGRKGLSLFKLKDMDIPVPEFFVISPTVFKEVVFESLDRDFDKLVHHGRNPEEDEVEKSIKKTNLNNNVLDEIQSAYTRISGFTDAWVSVRSSVVFPANPDVSFNGVFGTQLNVRNMSNVIEAVKEVYASMFSDDVVMYCANKGVDLSEVKMAVVVQRMVQAEVSGVAFTVDPITQDNGRMSVEAVYGLGDVIATGEITPDTYVLNKRDLSVVEKHISPQQWMRVRTVGVGKKRSSVEKISISQAWSHRQKVDENHLKEVSKIALVVENKAREPQNLEWVQAGGRVWVLQSKSLNDKFEPTRVTIVREDVDTLGEVVRAFVQRNRDMNQMEGKAIDGAKKIVKKQQHSEMVENLINIAKDVNKSKAKSEVRVQTRDDFLLSGIGASFGTVTGKIKIVEDGRKDVSVTKNDVLVVKSYANEMESMVMSAGAVITDTGGLTSDIAILCREFGIPAVVGAINASSVLKSGNLVRVDGNVGSVYKETDQSIVRGVSEDTQVHPVVDAYSNENLSGIDLLEEKEESKEKDTTVEPEVSDIPVDRTLSPTATKVFIQPDMDSEKLKQYVGNSHGLVYLDMDKIMLEQGRHLLAYVEDKKFVEYAKEIADKIVQYVELARGDEVILSIGSSTVAQFKDITKGKTMESSDVSDDAFGLTRYNNNTEFLRRTLKIVKRVRDLYKKRNVSLGVHAPMSGDMMKDFKKSLSSVGLRRSSTFNVYAIIDNPTEVILVDEIMNAKIDGVVLNMPRIARQMQGLRINDTKAKYNLSTNSMLKVVDNVIDILKPFKSQIFVVCEADEKLVAESINRGVFGVSVSAESIVDMRKLVAKEEAKLIMSK